MDNFTEKHSPKAKLGKQRIQRRTLIKAAGTGLVLGCYLPLKHEKVEANDSNSNSFAPNAFIRISPDSSITVLSKHIEFGQGTFTGLATLVAEELDADWAQMHAVHAPADNDRYKNLFFGIQGTGGSTAIANSYLQMREAGATARDLLVSAAAEKWKVPKSEISVLKGKISHNTSNNHASFGELADLASTLPLPTTQPKLKTPDQFKLIGQSLPKIDTNVKSTGKARFTLDIYLENMLTVVVAHPPRFGDKLVKFDESRARKVKGVVDIKAIPQGVAVYAKNTHAAILGRAALNTTWDSDSEKATSTEQLTKEYLDAVKKPGLPATTKGDVTASMAASEKTLEADYIFPFLAHVPMEPLDAVIAFQNGKVEAWMGSQFPTGDQAAIANVLGVDIQNVKINSQLAGGSFGRRAQPGAEFAAEAAQVVKAIKAKHPIKLLWTREDDIKGGRYRPFTVHKLRGGIDKNGHITAWQQSIATQSIVAGTDFAGMIQKGIDPTSVEGASDLPYAIPNLSVDLHTMPTKIPGLWWRSVGHTHTAFTVETFIDRLLELAGVDPIEGRLKLLNKEHHAREMNVLKRVSQMAEQAGPVPSSRARGVALHKSFNSYVAQIAEVYETGGLPRVHRVWCAVDCGLAINPNVIKAQMEGAIGYGLSAILNEQITVAEDGSVTQSNFHDYKPLRITDMPKIKVDIIPSAESPTGVGEPGTPPIGPAVVNAWRRLTGQVVNQMPLMKNIEQTGFI